MISVICKAAKYAKQRIKNRGIWGLFEFIAINISRRLPEPNSTNVFNREWDLLIILDGCRTDIFYEHVDADRPRTIISVGSKSDEWIQRTFDIPRMNTAYITANPFSESLDKHYVGYLDEVWNYAWNSKLGTVHPRNVTNSAIRFGRSDSKFDRVIVHYMQPHFPPLKEFETERLNTPDEFSEGRKSVWSKVRSGDISISNAWDLYNSNFRIVWKEVKSLVKNYDAKKVVVTADHGNAFNEWWILGHPHGVTHQSIRQVPWYETVANDMETRQVQSRPDMDDATLHEQLQALGYR